MNDPYNDALDREQRQRESQEDDRDWEEVESSSPTTDVFKEF